MTPLPFWIMLPYDSTLRFRVSVSGYGVPKDAGLLIGMQSGDWLVPQGLTDEFFLSVSFTSSPPESADHLHPWTGVLQVPKLKLPTSQALAPRSEGKLTPEQVDRFRSAVGAVLRAHGFVAPVSIDAAGSTAVLVSARTRSLGDLVLLAVIKMTPEREVVLEVTPVCSSRERMADDGPAV